MENPIARTAAEKQNYYRRLLIDEAPNEGALASEEWDMGKTLRSKTLYQDYDWLYQKYVKEKLSTVQIAKDYRDQCNRWCDPNTISRWLKKHDIPMRTLAEAQQNRHQVATPPAAAAGRKRAR